METKVILDTSVIFDFFIDGVYAEKVERLLEENLAILSSITVFEIFNGVTNKKHLEDRKKFVAFVIFIH